MPTLVNNAVNFANRENIDPIGRENLKGNAGKKAVLGDRTNLNGSTPSQKLKADMKRHKISYSVKKARSKNRLTALQRKFGKNDHEKVDPIDIEDLNSPRYAAEYVSDVVKTLKELEVSIDYRVDARYMRKQQDLNGKMRELLVDWLNQVHVKFMLSAPTFFLGVTLLDRFLGTAIVKRDKLQLVGCCAMWIASKYDEIYAPEINDFVAISDKSYTFLEMIKAEKYIVESLGYKIGGPTGYMFLRRFLKVHGCSIRLQHIAAYVLEFTQQKVEFLAYKPSHLAAAVLLFAASVEEFNVHHNKENVYGEIDFLELYPWDEVMERVSGYSKSYLLMEDTCIQQMQKLLNKNTKTSYRAAYKKYNQEKYMFVSNLDYSFPLEIDEDETMNTNF